MIRRQMHTFTLCVIACILLFSAVASPALAAPLPPGVVSPGLCTVKTDMQLQWLGTLYVNFHSRTLLSIYKRIPGGITPATVRLQGGVGNVQLTPAWADYVERVNSRDPRLIRYLFHADSGWQNSDTYARIEEVAFEGQTVNVVRISGQRAYIQTYYVNELQPWSISLSDPRIQLFTIVTRDDKLIGAPPGPARIILVARNGESLWIPVQYLTCGSRLPKSVVITAWPALTLRAEPRVASTRLGSLPQGDVALVQDTEIDALGNAWGRTAGGWIALLYQGQTFTDWRIAVVP